MSTRLLNQCFTELLVIVLLFLSSSSPSFASVSMISLSLSNHPPSPRRLYLLSSKVETEMERVEAAAALKASLFRESFSGLSGNPMPLAFDEFNVSSGVPVDDFSVDELLDLSNVNVFVDEEEEERQQQRTVEVEEHSNDLVASVSGFFEMDDFPVVSAGELSVPADDAADLEWLSNFVEDSSEYSTPFPAGMLLEKPWIQEPSGPKKAGSNELPCFMSPVPAKARSKRARTGARLWSLGSTPPSCESSGSSSSTSSTEPVYGESPVKKTKKRVNHWPGQLPRRCSHCGVNKTPQWRAGPHGAKTLCNACGVRFKSGRLLPEYRPACSPTFSSELHSNHHRKVLEMRLKKDSISDQPEPGLGVPIF